jgi:hypothetical protein
MSPAGYAVVNWTNDDTHMIEATTFTPTFPLPPTHILAEIKHNKFLNTTQTILQAQWDPSPSVGIAFYRIYSGDRIIATTEGTRIELLRSCGSTRGFSIAAVNEAGLESLRVPLVFAHQ